MEKRYFWIFGVLAAIIIVSILIIIKYNLISERLIDSKSLDLFLEDYCEIEGNCNLECEANLDCVVITCGEFNLATHKDAVESLNQEKIITDLCIEGSKIRVSNGIDTQCSSNKCVLKF